MVALPRPEGQKSVLMRGEGFWRKIGGGRLMPSIRVNRASIRDVNGARPLIIMERYPASLLHGRSAVYLKLFLTIAMLRREQQQL